MARVGAVVVTHQSKEVLPGCLAAIEEYDPAISVAVVDSGSPDGPPQVPAGVTLVAVRQNVGYGAAVNAGVDRLPHDCDVIVALNPDVRLMGPSLTELADGLRRRPDVGVATCPVIGPDGRRVASAWGPTSSVRALWFASGWQLPRLRSVVGRLGATGPLTSAAAMAREGMRVDGHVLGGAMAISRACWESVGGFDEEYFLYWEDADFCLRARRAGYEVRVLPCTPVVHAAGTSSAGVGDEQRWHWYLQGSQLFAAKHLSSAEGRRLVAALRLGRRLRR